MEIGRILGEGGFFRVSEITNITLRQEESAAQNGDHGSPDFEHVNENGDLELAPEICSASLKNDDMLELKSKTSQEGRRKRERRGRRLKRTSTSRSRRHSASVAASEDDIEEEYIQSVVQDRKFMEEHCLRKGYDGRYALKTMLDSSREDPDLFVNTLVDLAMEFHFLSTIRHPNILKMRAISFSSFTHDNGDQNGNDDDAGHFALIQQDAFLVLDRIYDTLSDRLVKWKATNESLFWKMFDFSHRKEKEFLARRLMVAYDIASAIDYLHERK